MNGVAATAASQSSVLVQAATKALVLANAQGQADNELLEQATQQDGPNEEGKGERIDTRA